MRLTTNKSKKTFVIGDVHGCFYTLKALISKLPINSRLIFVGDLVDKGNYSKEVVEFVIANNYEVVLGNHEFFMYKNIQKSVIDKDYTSDWATLEAYGGSQTITNYEENLELVSTHLKWIESLPKYLMVGKYFITHGFGLPYYKRRDQEEFQHALFSNRITDNEYKKGWEDYSCYDVVNIFGHCVFDEVYIGKNYYGIDTGCTYGKKLTAIELNSMKIIEQNTLDIDIK